MVPTGYEYTFLTDKSIRQFLDSLSIRLKKIWGNIYIELGPDWERYNFNDWLKSVNEFPDNLEIYFSSDESGFDYIEENGLVQNNSDIQFFLMEINSDSDLHYKMKVLGRVDQDNLNFGEFDCELYSDSMIRISLIVTTETIDEPDDLICITREILLN